MNLIRGTVKSKTIYLGLAVGLLGYIELHKDAVEPFIPEKYRGLVGMVLGGAIIVCRFFTSQTLTEKGTPDNANSNS